MTEINQVNCSPDYYRHHSDAEAIALGAVTKRIAWVGSFTSPYTGLHLVHYFNSSDKEIGYIIPSQMKKLFVFPEPRNWCAEFKDGARVTTHSLAYLYEGVA